MATWRPYHVAETWYGREARTPGKLRSLDVYAKVDGQWNQVASNVYPHPDAVQAQFEQAQRPRQHARPERVALLGAREAVWRAYFSNDKAQLNKLVPEEALVIDRLSCGPDIGNALTFLRTRSGSRQTAKS